MTHKVEPSSAIAQSCPDALHWDWYTIDQNGIVSSPFLLHIQDVQFLVGVGQKPQKHIGLRPTVVINYQDIEKRYPRLVKLLQWSLVLSQSEASCCIRDYMRGYECGSEAISWNGRTTRDAVIDAVEKRAIRYRLTWIKVKQGKNTSEEI